MTLAAFGFPPLFNLLFIMVKVKHFYVLNGTSRRLMGNCWYSLPAIERTKQPEIYNELIFI